jgi:hypothetical protein
MDTQKVMRRGLVTALAVSLTGIAACADIYSAPLRGGERCARCDRALDDIRLAGEIISPSKYVAYPFRTIRCMLTYLRDAPVPAERILVADYVTGRLVPVRQAHFVRVAIEEISSDRSYGVGGFDYVAFRSRAAATRFAQRYGTSAHDWASMQAADAMVALVADAGH